MRITTNTNYCFNWGSDRVKIKQVLFLDRYYLFIDLMDGSVPTVYHARKVLVQQWGWSGLLDRRISKTGTKCHKTLMFADLLRCVEHYDD